MIDQSKAFLADTQGQLEAIYPMVVEYGASVVGGILILIVGWMFAGMASGWVRKGLSQTQKVDATLTGFLSSLVRYVVLTVVVIAVLSQFGIEVTSFIAILGTLGLAIGLAMQGTLSNVAAGVMLLFFRPYRVGDYVVAGGHSGTIKHLTLFTTEMATPDNVQIIVPNGAIWGSSITNYSYHPTRRVDFNLGIAYGDSIDEAMKIIEDIIAGEERALKEPAHQVVVGELADSSVNIIVRVWVNSPDYWGVKFDLTKQFKQSFDKGGISIPFPQRELHFSPESLAALQQLSGTQSKAS